MITCASGFHSQKLRCFFSSNFLCIRIWKWWKWKLSLNYSKFSTSSILPKWSLKSWKWKLYPRFSINKLSRWKGNRWIRWMYSIDHRFTINHWISTMPRQSYFRRKRRMYPSISYVKCLMRCWLLEWRKWKHLSTSVHYRWLQKIYRYSFFDTSVSSFQQHSILVLADFIFLRLTFHFSWHSF